MWCRTTRRMTLGEQLIYPEGYPDDFECNNTEQSVTKTNTNPLTPSLGDCQNGSREEQTCQNGSLCRGCGERIRRGDLYPLYPLCPLCRAFEPLAELCTNCEKPLCDEGYCWACANPSQGVLENDRQNG